MLSCNVLAIIKAAGSIKEQKGLTHAAGGIRPESNVLALKR